MVVAGWNGIAISSLVEAAFVFDEPGWLEMAVETATFLRDVHIVGGELRRSSMLGQVHDGPGMAEDYGCVAEAFTRLAGATGDASWLRVAEQLVDRALEIFSHDDGGFHDTPDTGLYDRSRSVTDNVTPSGTMALVAALRAVGLLAERPELEKRADQAARTTWGALATSPRFAGAALADLLVSEEARRGLKRGVPVVVTEDPFDELARATVRMAPPGSVVLVARPGTEGFGTWLENRDAGAVYVCRGTVCFAPVHHYSELKTPLWSRV